MSHSTPTFCVFAKKRKPSQQTHMLAVYVCEPTSPEACNFTRTLGIGKGVLKVRQRNDGKYPGRATGVVG